MQSSKDSMQVILKPMEQNNVSLSQLLQMAVPLPDLTVVVLLYLQVPGSSHERPSTTMEVMSVSGRVILRQNSMSDNLEIRPHFVYQQVTEIQSLHDGQLDGVVSKHGISSVPVSNSWVKHSSTIKLLRYTSRIQTIALR